MAHSKCLACRARVWREVPPTRSLPRMRGPLQPVSDASELIGLRCSAGPPAGHARLDPRSGSNGSLRRSASRSPVTTPSAGGGPRRMHQPTITAVFKDGPLKGTRVQVESLEGRPPMTRPRQRRRRRRMPLLPGGLTQGGGLGASTLLVPRATADAGCRSAVAGRRPPRPVRRPVLRGPRRSSRTRRIPPSSRIRRQPSPRSGRAGYRRAHCTARSRRSVVWLEATGSRIDRGGDERLSDCSNALGRPVGAPVGPGALQRADDERDARDVDAAPRPSARR